MPRPLKAQNEKKDRRLTVYFTPYEETKLNQISAQLKMNKTKVIRNALQNWIKDNEGNKNILSKDKTKPSVNIESFKFKKVVEYVVNKVSEILDAEMAGVMLYDENRRELVLAKPAFGIENEEDINEYRVSVDGIGNAVNVFLTGLPSISNDTLSDPRFLNHFVLKFGARNTITVPLEVNSRRIGVLHVNNKNNEKFFTKKDVELLRLLSSHLALLLENAAYFEKEKEQSEILKLINLDLDNKQKRLRKLMDIHGKLIQKVLYGEGLSAITITLAELLNSRVVLEDKHFNIICTSHPINMQHPQAKELLKTIKDCEPIQCKLKEAIYLKKLQFIPSFPDEGITYKRILVPLTDKSGILGYLSVILQEKLDEIDIIAVEQAALVASLELAKEKNAYEIEAALKGEFLDLLLRGDFKSENDIFERAKFLNYDISKPQSVTVTRLTRASEKKNETSITSKKTFNNLVFLVKQAFPQSIILPRGNEAIILTPQCEQQVLSERLNYIFTEIEKKYPSSQLIAGIGKLFTGISMIKESFQQAKNVLNVISIFPNVGKVANYDHLGIYNLLYNINDHGVLRRFVQEKIGSLLEYDKKKKGSLLLTLEIYSKNNYVAKKAAKQLFIHVKTMDYRLNRIKEILKIDCFDSEICTEVNIAIKIYNTHFRDKEGF